MLAPTWLPVVMLEDVGANAVAVGNILKSVLSFDPHEDPEVIVIQSGPQFTALLSDHVKIVAHVLQASGSEALLCIVKFFPSLRKDHYWHRSLIRMEAERDC